MGIPSGVHGVWIGRRERTWSMKDVLLGEVPPQHKLGRRAPQVHDELRSVVALTDLAMISSRQLNFVRPPLRLPEREPMPLQPRLSSVGSILLVFAALVG